MEKGQIIKALECCSTPSGKRCENCPKVTEDALCMYRLSGDALALIKQQDEQIFQLENRLKECENGYSGTLHIESCKLHDAEERIKELTIELDAMRGAANSYKMHNERLTEENERLEKENDDLVSEKVIYIQEKVTLKDENERLKNICNSYALQYGTARDKEVFLKKEREDTVREFAERLKAEAYVPKPYGMSKVVDVGTIDRIAKEILNKTEDEKK